MDEMNCQLIRMTNKTDTMDIVGCKRKQRQEKFDKKEMETGLKFQPKAYIWKPHQVSGSISPEIS